MKPQDQRFFPVEGAMQGDCWRACIASITETHIEFVPHFVLFDSSWWRATNLWLAPRDLAIDQRGTPESGEYVILCGVSPRDPKITHCVVALATDRPASEWEIVHDPHPTRAGILTRDEVWRIHGPAISFR